MISLVNVDVTLGGTPLFKQLNWQLARGQRAGLVGPNGAGKSTLLKLISGTMDSDRGDVVLQPGVSIGYLAQEVPLATTETPWAIAESVFTELKQLQAKIVSLSDRLAACSPDEQSIILSQLEKLQNQWEHQGGYEFEIEIGAVLSGLGFRREQFHEPMSTFSGGWRARVYLAKVLLTKPDVYLLDEPTNHLDIQALEWLTDHLLGRSATLIVVSHDRWFLNRICNHIAELSDQGVYFAKGNFDVYVGNLDERARQLEVQAKKHNAQVHRLSRFIERFGAKASKAKQAQSKMKRLDKLGEAETVSTVQQNHFALPSPAPSDRVLLELRDVDFRYGAEPVFTNVSATITKGSRIGLVGINGAGKSTLMGLISGKLQPSSGDRTPSDRLNTFLFEQHQVDALPSEMNAIEAIECSAASTVNATQIRSALGAFGLSGDAGFKTVKVLSGGEKARVALTKVLMRPVNLVLLDEPTNHLDMPSKAILERALVGYDGTLIVISHDRRFLNEVCTEIWAIEGGTVNRYLGNYEDYISKVSADQRSVGHEGSSEAHGDTAQVKNQKSRRKHDAERRQYEQKVLRPAQRAMDKLEALLMEVEVELERLQQEQLEPGHHENVERVIEVAKAISVQQIEQDRIYEAYGESVESFEELKLSLNS